MLTLAALGFVALGFRMWTLTGMQGETGSFYNRSVGLITIIFLGFCSFYGIIKLSDPRPGLIIFRNGLLDNSSGMGCQFIQWSEIVKFDIVKIQTTKFILIFVHNPQDFINRARLFQRFWMKMNKRIYGTPLSISSLALNCDFNTLNDLFNKNFNSAKDQIR